MISVGAIRRFPVKAMGGEDLDEVEVDARGLVGDRWFAVTDGEGRFAAGKDSRRFRRLDPVFDFRASTAHGEVQVEGDCGRWKAGDPGLDDRLTDLMSTPVRVLEERETMHFDQSPVSLIGTATLAWITAELSLDGDRRRFRANLVVATDEPFVEETWIGREIAVGGVVLAVTERTTRCRTINLAQDGVAEKQPLLKALAPRDLKLAVYADVAAPGRIRVGDGVSIRR